MKKLLFNNTYKKGSVTYLILGRKNQYTGICLEFDLEVKAKTLKKAKEKIEDYSHVWLENAIKHKLSEEVLNRPAPKKYWKIYEDLLKNDLKKIEVEKKPSTTTTFDFPQVFRFQSPYPNFAFT